MNDIPRSRVLQVLENAGITPDTHHIVFLPCLARTSTVQTIQVPPHGTLYWRFQSRTEDRRPRVLLAFRLEAPTQRTLIEERLHFQPAPTRSIQLDALL